MGNMDRELVPDAVQSIAPFPPAVVELLHRIPMSQKDPYEVADLVASDPQWQAEIARVVMGTAASEVRDPAEIVRELETGELAKTAIVVASHAYVRDMGRSELRRYWRYSVACAIASEELARCGQVNRALAYSGGLLHDIGRLGLMSAYPEKYANLLSLAERMLAEGQQFEIAEYERLLFGMDRYSAAEWLAEAWRLPATFVPIVTKFKETGRVRELDFVNTVRFGCRLANSLGFGLMLGVRRTGPRQILTELPRTVQSQWTDFNDLSATIESRRLQYEDPVPVA